MKKRIFIFSLLTVIMISAPIFLYFYFSPKTTTPKPMAMAASSEVAYYDFVNAKEFEEGKYVLFVHNNDQDADFITNSLLDPLSKIDVNVLPEITSITLKDAKDITVMQLKDRFKIERVPAFVYMEMDKEGNCNIISTITHYSDAPLTSETLKDWFFENGLWNGPYKK